MRFRRQGLQVNTFPFLAVLLCAMGSLILLLLVIDRRARVVARARAVQAAEAVTAVQMRTQLNQRAEWEKRRAILHERLAGDNQSAIKALRDMKLQLETAGHKVAAKQRDTQALETRMALQRSALAARESGLAGRRKIVTETVQQAQLSQTELALLTRELLEMERTLVDLKEFRKRQQQTYSLVPYQGKRGDDRRPIYIECAAGGVIFHPDRLHLEGAKLPDLRAEIERRVAKSGVVLSSAPGTPQKQVYLLMLVRPDGVTTYYRTLAALHGMEVEFGYEFIDADWLLDFSDSSGVASSQPWMQTATTDYPVRSTVNRKVSGIRNPVSAESETARGQRSDSSSERRLTNAGHAFSRREVDATRTGQPITQLPMTLNPPTAVPAESLKVAGPDEHSTAGVMRVPRSFGTPNVGQALRGAADRNGETELQTVPHEDGLSPAPLAPSTMQKQDKGGQVSIQSAIRATDSTRKADERRDSGVAASPGTSNRGPKATEEEQPAGSALPRDPISGLFPADQKKRPPRPLPFTGLLNGNRDWIIAVECRADGVTLLPSQIRLSNAQFAGLGTAKNPLSDLVRQLIVRRQASLRVGELPYRPIIHFRVWPDGVRTYYEAYPILEKLGIPMARENPEPAEAKKEPN